MDRYGALFPREISVARGWLPAGKLSREKGREGQGKRRRERAGEEGERRGEKNKR